jgi:hypothetical protein
MQLHASVSRLHFQFELYTDVHDILYTNPGLTLHNNLHTTDIVERPCPIWTMPRSMWSVIVTNISSEAWRAKSPATASCPWSESPVRVTSLYAACRPAAPEERHVNEHVTESSAYHRPAPLIQRTRRPVSADNTNTLRYLVCSFKQDTKRRTWGRGRGSFRIIALSTTPGDMIRCRCRGGWDQGARDRALEGQCLAMQDYIVTVTECGPILLRLPSA